MNAEFNRRDSFQSYINKRNMFWVNEEVLKFMVVVTRKEGKKERRKKGK